MPAFQNVGLELSFNQKKNNITPSHKEIEIERKTIIGILIVGF